MALDENVVSFKKDVDKVDRILVIKLRAVGDVLLSTIVTKNLRLAFPQAEIDYLVEPPSVDVLKGNPFVNDTLVFNKKKMMGWTLISMVRSRKYDLILDLFGNPRTALLTRLSGAKHRVGYRFLGRIYAYNNIIMPRGGEVHNTQFNLDALEGIGIEIRDRNLYFQFVPEDLSYVDSFLAEAGLQNKLLVCLNPGGGWYTKRWGVNKFALLGDRLVETYGARILVSWGPGQIEEAEEIKTLMNHDVFIPPPTTLPQLGALLKRCSVVVSNDSGPMHIAAAVKTPVLGIYGPTSPKLQGPYGDQHVTVRNESLDCLGCNFTKCPIGIPCMLELDVDTVVRGMEELMKKNSLK